MLRAYFPPRLELKKYPEMGDAISPRVKEVVKSSNSSAREEAGAVPSDTRGSRVWEGLTYSIRTPAISLEVTKIPKNAPKQVFRWAGRDSNSRPWD